MLRKFVPLACLAALLCAACGRSSDDDDDDSDRRSRRRRSARKLDDAVFNDLPRRTSSPRYKGPAVALDIKFKPGSYVQTESMGIDGTMTIRAQGRSQDIDTGQDVLVEADVEIHPPAVGSGERKIDYTCRRVKVNVKAGGRTMTYDSSGPKYGQDRKLARALAPVVGWRGVQVYSREGKFLRLEGLRQLGTELTAAGGGAQSTAAFRKMLEPLLKEVLTRHWGKLFPDHPVKPGDEWTRRIDLTQFPMFGKLDIDFECRLDDIETTPHGQVAVIYCEGTAEATDRKLDMSAAGMPAGADVRAKELTVQTAMVIRFDLDIGLATKLDARGKVAASLDMKMQGQRATMDMDQTLRIGCSLQRRGEAVRRPRRTRPATTVIGPRRRRRIDERMKD